MKCQKCKKRQATVIYTENINGKKTKYALCESCAKELDIDNMIIDDFENTLFKSFFKQNILENKEEKRKCKCCGCTFEDIVKMEKLGCSNCYDEFKDKLDVIFKKMHGKNRYTGQKRLVTSKEVEKKEIKETEEVKEKTEIEKLEDKLKELIVEEKYEEAAVVRDKIAELKGKAE